MKLFASMLHYEKPEEDVEVGRHEATISIQFALTSKILFLA